MFRSLNAGALVEVNLPLPEVLELAKSSCFQGVDI